MNKKRGFVLIEAIFMIVFISVALLLVYKAFATSFQDEKKRVNYDNTETIYKTYFLKQYFEENGLLDYLTTVTLTNGYLEISCSTLTSVNNEYCSFLTSATNLNVTKIYITKLDMSGMTYTNLDATTIDYMKTLSSDDSASYRFIVWYGDNKYASLKLGDPFYNLRVYLDGGTWDGISPQRLIGGNTTTIKEPTKEGFAFAGWNIVGTGSSVNGTTFTMGTEDTSLIATWQLPIYNYAYTGSYQLFTAPFTGYYNVELYGAQGGSNVGMEGTMAGNVGGLGGYNKGTIYLSKNDKLYVYVGGQGQYASSVGLESTKGYNGGGIAGYEASCGTSCMKGAGGGGGATDIRYFGSTVPTSSELLWNSTLGLNSRIMVAGAGGGAMNWSSPKPGGAGGNFIAWPGKEYNVSGYSYTNAQGGTQIAGGAGGVGSASASPGTFGIGGNAYSIYGGGGGGGYYGGGGGAVNSNVVGSGAGGSSFISGYAGSNAITSASSTTATNNTIHYSGKYFINSQMKDYVNSGNGSAKISYVGTTSPTRVNTTLNNVRYIKDCINQSNVNVGNHWVELQAIYNGINVAKGKTVTGNYSISSSSYITDGDITTANYATASGGPACAIIDLGQAYNLDEIAVWHYWGDGRTYYSNATSVSSDNSNWTTVISSLTPENNQGKRVNAYSNNYPYTGGAQTFTVPYTGNYKIELWGASGGDGSTTYKGGMGGYTKGEIYLTQGTNLYIYVGGVGPAVGTATNTTGGYNGGGNCYSYAANYVTGCGGGATDIRTTSGAWNDATSLASRIMVAGAGGGGHYRSDTSSYGGSAGGLSGNPSSGETSGYTELYPTGGSQTAGGAKGYVDVSSRMTSLTDSGFGYGGSINTSALTWNLLGGGSGYYGGGAGVFMASSGGSSYISGHTGCVAITSSSSTSPRTGTGGAACSQGGTDNVCSLHYSGKYFTNTLMIDGSGYTWTNTKASTYGTNVMPRPNGGNYEPGYGNTGNGYAKITYLGS